MSKRVANTRDKTIAHFGRIRYGWRIYKATLDLDKVEEELEDENLEEAVRARYEDFKQRARAILPKRLLRRTQGR